MNIKVVRYPVPSQEERDRVQAEYPEHKVHFPSDSWEGYIEPEDASWIVFVGTDHKPVVFLNRDENGGVLTPGIGDYDPLPDADDTGEMRFAEGIAGPPVADLISEVEVMPPNGTWSPPLSSEG